MKYLVTLGSSRDHLCMEYEFGIASYAQSRLIDSSTTLIVLELSTKSFHNVHS